MVRHYNHYKQEAGCRGLVRVGVASLYLYPHPENSDDLECVHNIAKRADKRVHSGSSQG